MLGMCIGVPTGKIDSRVVLSLLILIGFTAKKKTSNNYSAVHWQNSNAFRGFSVCVNSNWNNDSFM